MNVMDAAKNIAGKVGMATLAGQMGVDYSQLKGKLNQNNPRNRFYLEEAVQMQSVSGHYDILYAMAAELGHACIPLPDSGATNFPQAITRTCAEFGDFMRKVDEVFDDSEITPNEAKALRKELTEMISAAVRLQSILEGHVSSSERRKVAR